jgi:hypothetical protein
VHEIDSRVAPQDSESFLVLVLAVIVSVHENQLDNGCDQNIVVYNSEC